MTCFPRLAREDREAMHHDDHPAGLNRLRAGLTRLRDAGEPAPDPTTPDGARRLALAILQEDADRLHRRPLDDHGWADLVTTPARGADRPLALTRLTGKLLADGVAPHLTGAIAQTVNAARCVPPLPPAEVDQLVDWVCDRHADALQEHRT
jgi:hypothetical protein